MNAEQKQAALAAMSEWLAHPQEWGQPPARIECTGSFMLHDMQYYLFRFQKEAAGPWLLGVCGGYEGDGLEHCGHVYSEMEEYCADTAVERATAMVEHIRSHWMRQAEEEQQRKERAGSFVGFVLLSQPSWDKEQLQRDLREKWGLEAEESAFAAGDEAMQALVFDVGGMRVALCLVAAPIPDDEAVHNAANNYMWPEAVEAAKAHKAHLMVAVLGKEAGLLERGRLFVQLLAACCRQPCVTGVYTSGVVFEPGYYEKCAEIMREGALPVYNLVWFGLYRSPQGVCGYTYGMDIFGKDEMEVLDADAQPFEVRDFLTNMAAYVLEQDVTLRDGETIGFSEEDKHAITRSQGVSLPGMTLKIEY